MALALDIVAVVLLAAGVVFFAAGTVGLLRFPDVFTCLHATGKADNLGLGLVTLGLMLRAEWPWQALKLLAIWLLAMLAGSVVCHLVARAALRAGVRPWEAR